MIQKIEADNYLASEMLLPENRKYTKLFGFIQMVLN